MDKLRKKIAQLPDAPGVYLMKDASGSVIYIGKAKSLKKRLASYMGRELSTKTVRLMAGVADIEYQLTPTESLALLLEASLIHRYKPKYNVSLRDDKSFPMVKITNEEFPAVYITRKKLQDGASYFGPFTNPKLLRQALRIIRRHFPYRSCRSLPKRVCIYYRLKLSPAPCIGKITRRSYVKSIANISLILEGKVEQLIQKLSQQMKLKSRNLEYEEAAEIRDQITALTSLGLAQARASGYRRDLEDLRKLLKLKRLPERIEAFDISDISGQEACGSMASFWRGQPDKDNYRRFRIKTVRGIDDYKMLAEVVCRRYSRVIEEKLPYPYLILIDGGRQHLSAAVKELDKLGLDIPVASIAKGEENIYTKSSPNVIKLDRDTAALNLIRRVRDEAHRFALSYHHLLHKKKIIGDKR